MTTAATSIIRAAMVRTRTNSTTWRDTRQAVTGINNLDRVLNRIIVSHEKTHPFF